MNNALTSLANDLRNAAQKFDELNASIGKYLKTVTSTSEDLLRGTYNLNKESANLVTNCGITTRWSYKNETRRKCSVNFMITGNFYRFNSDKKIMLIDIISKDRVWQINEIGDFRTFLKKFELEKYTTWIVDACMSHTKNIKFADNAKVPDYYKKLLILK